MIWDWTERVLVWTVRRLGGLTVIRLLLLTLALANVGWGMTVIIGKISAGNLVAVALTAMLAGWLVGRTGWKGYVSVLVLLVLGAAYLTLVPGRIWKPFMDFNRTITPLTGQVLHCTIWPSLKHVLACGSPQFEPFFDTWKTLTLTTSALGNHIDSWFRGVHSGLMVVDPLVAPMLWGTVLWLVSGWAGWWVRRKNSVLIALLPAIAVFSYNLYYTNKAAGIYYRVWAAGGMLLLQAANAYRLSEKHWTDRRMDRVLIEPGLGAAVVVLTAALMLGGGLLPSFSIHKINQAFHDIFHPQPNKTLAESLGLQQGSSGSKGGQAGAGPVVIADVHAIGAGPHLSQDVVMTVSVDGYNPLPPDIARQTHAPAPDVTYYWRAQTYDTYNGHVWVADSYQTVSLKANAPYQPNLADLASNYKLVTQHIERRDQNDKVLFFTGDLLSTDQLSVGQFRPGGELIDAQVDARQYTAFSRMQYVTVAQMQSVDPVFPDAIRQRYLQLPDELPQRVRDLALNLTADKVNLYDRAKAIETYLRQFGYTLDVPAPPSNRDVADYFLFDLKKGYCDYFATTMVVMARAAGLPARLVTGYSSGTYDYNAHHFTVVAANSHAWVEIYFPGLGWVEFEPTTNQNPIAHPGEEQQPDKATSKVPTPAPTPEKTGLAAIPWNELIRPLEILIAVLAFLGILYLILPLDVWIMYSLPAEKTIQAVYKRIYRRSHAWGVEPDAARTPNEFAKALAVKLEPFLKDRRMKDRVKAVLADLDWLTGMYNRQLFSPVSLTWEEHRQVVSAWGRMRGLFSRLQRW